MKLYQILTNFYNFCIVVIVNKRHMQPHIKLPISS